MNPMYDVILRQRLIVDPENEMTGENPRRSFETELTTTIPFVPTTDMFFDVENMDGEEFGPGVKEVTWSLYRKAFVVRLGDSYLINMGDARVEDELVERRDFGWKTEEIFEPEEDEES